VVPKRPVFHIQVVNLCVIELVDTVLKIVIDIYPELVRALIIQREVQAPIEFQVIALRFNVLFSSFCRL
jgi:hypothetical protein